MTAMPYAIMSKKLERQSMRAIQAYKNIKQFSYWNEFDILVWKLCLIRNKQLGLTTVLYTTLNDAEEFEMHDLLRFYDEVYYLDDQRFARINWGVFWASIKFFALEAELSRDSDEPFFLQDEDLVFCEESVLAKLNHPIVFWYEKENIMHYKDNLQLPKGWQYPSYYSFRVIPYTTAIIKIDDKKILREYLDLVFGFILDNYVSGETAMITVEQRFMANLIVSKQLKPSFVLDHIYPARFDIDHFHIWGLKHFIHSSQKYTYWWLKSILILLKRYSITEYQKALAMAGPDTQYVIDHWDEIQPAPQFKNYKLED